MIILDRMQRPAGIARIFSEQCFGPTAVLSYAENGEDVVPNRVFGCQRRSFYIEIGAYHPVADSITSRFYKRGWRGMNAEPDRAMFMAFIEDRPRDINMKTVMGRNRAHILSDPTATHGRRTLDVALAGGGNGRSPERVPVVTMSDVIDYCGPKGGKIDFFHIDVDGPEVEVIASGDWISHRPRVLVIQAVDDAENATYGLGSQRCWT